MIMMESSLLKNTKTSSNLLLVGVGNASRGDDALGWDFVKIVAENFDDAEVEYRYQLQVEDSDLFSRYDTIIVADASHEVYTSGFQIGLCKPAPHYFFSSHAQKPETILHLTNEVFDAYPQVYVVAISGYHWELSDGLSVEAAVNLNKAISYFKQHFLDFEMTSEVVVRN